MNGEKAKRLQDEVLHEYTSTSICRIPARPWICTISICPKIYSYFTSGERFLVCSARRTSVAPSELKVPTVYAQNVFKQDSWVVRSDKSLVTSALLPASEVFSQTSGTAMSHVLL